ncbi:hypothetical protein [Amycolatopsis sp. DSM 110486]|uniref:hypothetical protein n=1 Tax=Amycolatopsis sp. DSM 110486 TaxID=2865832 RepID=UPI001C695CBE|nr:hypothetical protein [Amycolatopsis sp. DSM 110486]QYN25291.1 hypothetical protein K1T34_24370 [Amycolatopsis sp. DSM 110486]
MTVGWWITDDGHEVDTDRDTGQIIDDAGRRTVADFAAWALTGIEQGRTIDDLAKTAQCGDALIRLAILVARRRRAAGHHTAEARRADDRLAEDAARDRVAEARPAEARPAEDRAAADRVAEGPTSEHQPAGDRAAKDRAAENATHT